MNEDAVCVVCPAQLDSFLSRGMLALVADGMGGAQGGSCASAVAASLIPSIFLENVDAPPVALKKALNIVNSNIFAIASKDPELEGMGTTCVVLVLTPEEAWTAWVGDSRLYLLRKGQLFQMTEDHSLVAGLVRSGVLTVEQASYHDDRHVLTRALGTRREVEISLWEQPISVHPGDRFLLCSDGLHDLLSQQDLLDLASRGSVEEAGAALVATANERGGPDNISSILLEVAAQGSPSGCTPEREHGPEGALST